MSPSSVSSPISPLSDGAAQSGGAEECHPVDMAPADAAAGAETSQRTDTTPSADPGAQADQVGPPEPTVRLRAGGGVAQVYVDVGLPHLDRPFDYAVPEEWGDQVQPGVRVKVRFAGRRLDGWVVGLSDHSDHGRLSPLLKLVSPEPVLPAQSARLFRAVADHCGGMFCDVARLAVPPRHAAAEKAVRRADEVSSGNEGRRSGPLAQEAGGCHTGDAPAPSPDTTSGDRVLTPEGCRTPQAVAPSYPPLVPAEPEACRPDVGTDRGNALPAVVDDSALDLYPTGTEFLRALATGGRPRAAWTPVPVADRAGDWADGLAAAAAATVRGGRSAVLVVPGIADCDRLAAALARRLDPALVVRQTADLGPAARYRGFLRALRGDVRVVIGTRAAAYAPLSDVGLLAAWDDGDDLHADRHAPYPQTRDVLALRAAQQGTAVLFAACARSTELQTWVEAGWLKALTLPSRERRRRAPRTRIASQGDSAQASDPAAGVARLPHDVFTAVRDGLTVGPVLVQVPRAGFRRRLSCLGCGEPVRCLGCAGPLETGSLGRKPVPSEDRRLPSRPEPAGRNSVATHAARSPGRDRASTRAPGPGGPDTLVCDWCGRDGSDWACPGCRSRRWRAGAVGNRQTARDLERAFPGVTVRHSDGEAPLATVPDEPALIVATPGAEPTAEGGYASVILLDARVLLNRPSLKAGEEALRRWLAATALVRPGAVGGQALLVGPPMDRAVQAWLRLDPVGFADHELADRRAAGLPPAVRLAAVTGEAAAVDDVARAAAEADWVDILGPVPAGPDEARLLLRSAVERGRDLAGLVQQLASARSAAKAVGAVRWQLDPVDLA